jgi:hypothetical protein
LKEESQIASDEILLKKWVECQWKKEKRAKNLGLESKKNMKKFTNQVQVLESKLQSSNTYIQQIKIKLRGFWDANSNQLQTWIELLEANNKQLGTEVQQFKLELEQMRCSREDKKSSPIQMFGALKSLKVALKCNVNKQH